METSHQASLIMLLVFTLFIAPTTMTRTRWFRARSSRCYQWTQHRGEKAQKEPFAGLVNHQLRPPGRGEGKEFHTPSNFGIHHPVGASVDHCARVPDTCQPQCTDSDNDVVSLQAHKCSTRLNMHAAVRRSHRWPRRTARRCPWPTCRRPPRRRACP